MASKRTIHDVRAAGYEVALASGSVSVEEEALEEAQKNAAPEAVAGDAEKIATEVAHLAVAKGAKGSDLETIVQRATSRALEQIGQARDETVAFHERALEIARSSPDVYFVSTLGDPDTPHDDVQLYVACKPDGSGWDEGAQETLTSLCAPPDSK